MMGAGRAFVYLWFIVQRDTQRLREEWTRRELRQPSLADGLVDGGARRSQQLEKIAAPVDWTAFEPALRRTLSGAGEAAFPCLNS